MTSVLASRLADSVSHEGLQNRRAEADTIHEGRGPSSACWSRARHGLCLCLGRIQKNLYNGPPLPVRVASPGVSQSLQGVARQAGHAVGIAGCPPAPPDRLGRKAAAHPSGPSVFPFPWFLHPCILSSDLSVLLGLCEGSALLWVGQGWAWVSQVRCLQGE